jgi:hypothetical protein
LNTTLEESIPSLKHFKLFAGINPAAAGLGYPARENLKKQVSAALKTPEKG